MPTRPRIRRRQPHASLVKPRTLYLGPWLVQLGRKQIEAAEIADVKPAYINELVSGKKQNPHPIVLLTISEWLGITVNDLYRQPADAAPVQGAATYLQAHELAHLRAIIRERGGLILDTNVAIEAAEKPVPPPKGRGKKKGTPRDDHPR